MSIGPLGFVGSAAAAPQAQRASDTEQARAADAEQSRAAASEERADSAAGVGQMAEDQEVSERDADGRRPWEQTEREKKRQTPDPAPSKDASGERGKTLDLTG